MKLLGRLGWHGQCACCCGPDGKRTIKRQEERQWRREGRMDSFPVPPPIPAGPDWPQTLLGQPVD